MITLSPNGKPSFTVQSYSGSPTIEGVQIVDLKRHLVVQPAGLSAPAAAGCHFDVISLLR